jgi:subtilase family serine protease
MIVISVVISGLAIAPTEGKALQLPDLTLKPDDISFSDDSPVVGQTITVWSKVHNIGNDIAYNIPIYFYDNATSIGIAVISLIEPARDRSTYTLWTPTRVGLTNITVVIDPFNLINESNEDNNFAWRDINVLEPLLPDLWVDWISFSNDHPKSGETITISASVKNGGRVDAKDVVVSFIDNNTVFGYGFVSSIGPNQSYSMKAQWTAKANVGDVTTPRVIEVFVDPEDKIDEITESNNTFTRVIFVGRPLLPDLTTQPKDIYFSTDTPVDNETVTLYAKVSNLGNVSASNVVVLYLADSKPIGVHVIDSVSGGLSSISWIDWVAWAGFHTITVSIDPNNTIKELDKTNNVVSKSVVIDDYLPQISFLNISSSESMVLENMTVTLYADLANLGRDAAYGILVRFFDRHGPSETEIGSQYMSMISSNASRRAFVKWFANPSGNHIIVVRADAEYTAGEFDLTHSEINKTIYVWPSLPDLEVVSLSIYPRSVGEGEPARVNATVRNHGMIEARDVNVILIDNGDVVVSTFFTISADPTGSTKMNLTFNYTARAGVRNLTVMLDPQNRIREYNENDNSMTMIIDIPAKPVSFNWFAVLMILLILSLFAVTAFIWREKILALSIALAAWFLTLALDVPLLKGVVDKIYARTKQKR